VCVCVSVWAPAQRTLEWRHMSLLRERVFQVTDFHKTLWEGCAICGHIKTAIFSITQSLTHNNMAGTQTGGVGTPLVPITWEPGMKYYVDLGKICNDYYEAESTNKVNLLNTCFTFWFSFILILFWGLCLMCLWALFSKFQRIFSVAS